MSKKTILKKACKGKGGVISDVANNVGDVVNSAVKGAKDTYKQNIENDKRLMGGNDPISYAEAGVKGLIGGVVGAIKGIKNINNTKTKTPIVKPYVPSESKKREILSRVVKSKPLPAPRTKPLESDSLPEKYKDYKGPIPQPVNRMLPKDRENWYKNARPAMEQRRKMIKVADGK